MAKSIIRIGGVDIYDKIADVALSDIFGIGRPLALRILKRNNIKNKKTSEYTEEELLKIKKDIEENCKIEGDLRGEIKNNIKNLTLMGCYRGIRHKKGLPVRGQRTKTNCRTRKGKRKTVANKKKAEK
jgi:small subunit ribosomal protein S13